MEGITKKGKGGEDLLSMLNGSRSKPIATSANPTGYTGRSIIVEASGEDAIMNADDVFYYNSPPGLARWIC